VARANCSLEAAHEGAALAGAAPGLAKLVAVKGVGQRHGRHDFGGRGERRIVDLLIAAQMIAVVQAAGLQLHLIAGLEAGGAGERGQMGMAVGGRGLALDGDLDRRALDGHHVGQEIAAHLACETHQRIFLRGIGPLVHQQDGTRLQRTLRRLAERRGSAHHGDDGEALDRHSPPGALAHAPGEDRLLAGEVDLGVGEAGTGVDVGGAGFQVVAGDGGAGEAEGGRSGHEGQGQERPDEDSVRLHGSPPCRPLQCSRPVD
jgi:hypothetical protein